jgi:alpha-glucosidase
MKQSPRVAIYQVFPDRFAIGRPPSGDPPLDHPFYRRPGHSLVGWGSPPVRPAHGRDHQGGNLDGIRERLGHLEHLGVDALYLTPIFEATSNHRYDLLDHHRVCPALGGEAAFERLARALAERGMGLVLDGVFNHVGRDHRWVVEGRHDLLRAGPSPGTPAAWRGHTSLAEVDVEATEVRAQLIDGPASAARHWLRRGATGWRLDCANDLGPRTCRRLTRAAAEEGAADGVIGEVMAFAADWTADGILDGVMNYYFRESVVAALAWPPRIPAVQLGENLAQLAARFPPSALLRSWNVLASHDVPRLKSALGPGPLAAERARLATLLMFAFPGVPLIYYGEELGLGGGEDPDNRGAMPWDRPELWDGATLAWHRQLIALRRQQPALLSGDHLPAPQPGRPELLVFGRKTAVPGQACYLVANLAAEPVEALVFIPCGQLYDGLPLVDLLAPADAPRLHPGRGSLEVRLPAFSALLLAPADDHPSGYRFFKPGPAAAGGALDRGG